MAVARTRWHQRLEAQVALTLGVLIALALGGLIGIATIEVRQRAVDRADDDLAGARGAFDSLVRTRAEFATSSARVFVSAQPYFRALLDGVSSDVERQTLSGMADGYRQGLGASFAIVTDHAGLWTGQPGWGAGLAPPAELNDAIATAATRGVSATAIIEANGVVFLVVSEPARFAEETLGTITVGYPLNDDVARQLASATASDINLLAGSVVSGSSLPGDARAEFARRASTRASVWLVDRPVLETFGDARYFTRAFPLSQRNDARLVLLRDDRPTELFIARLRQRLLIGGLVVFVLVLASGAALTRRLTRPLSELALAAGDIASGNWERRVPITGAAEARTTAVAFNEMTAGLQHWYDDAKKKQEQLTQAQKLEAIGRLAGGIAHDFNNLLTVIIGYGQEVQSKLLSDDAKYADMKEVLDAGYRAAGLTQQLLAFSRKQVLSPRVLDLAVVVRGTERLLTRLIGEDVALGVRVTPDLWRVIADPGQIEQVLVNLAVNARDAMPTGGRLAITLENVTMDPTRSRAGLSAGHYVELTVSDTGQGMSEAVRSRIFEPFFTTKAEGKGTGLGLATVYGVVQQSGGGIDVDSAEGVGTTFRVWFPRVVDGVTAEETAAITGVSRGTETILVVEDDAVIRTLVEKSLRGRGYDVVSAESGERALGMLAAARRSVALLLADAVLPGMSGRGLAERVAVESPETKLLLTSGHTDETLARHGLAISPDTFLRKPFSMDALAARVRQAIDEGQTCAIVVDQWRDTTHF